MIQSVSFGRITTSATNAIKESTMSRLDKKQIIENLDKNDSAHVYKVNKDTVEIYGSTHPYKVNSLKIMKPDTCFNLKVATHDNPDKIIYPKTTDAERFILSKTDVDNSHVVSAWLMANRMKELDKKVKDLPEMAYEYAKRMDYTI